MKIHQNRVYMFHKVYGIAHERPGEDTLPEACFLVLLKILDIFYDKWMLLLINT